MISKFAIGLSVTVVALLATAQVLQSLDLDEGCGFTELTPKRRAYTFTSDGEAVSAIGRIVGVVGLRQNFEVYAAEVSNAQASMSNSKRMILYNQYFMRQVEDRTNNKWAAISILAHEIGHHINGDTFGINGQTKMQKHTAELEADRFSGSVLQKMGASVDDALVAMRTIASDRESDSHPAKNTRLAAISNGYYQSKDMSAGTSNSNRMPPTPAPSQSPIPTSVPAPNRNNVLIANQYQVLGDGSEIRDISSNLIWQRCSVGQSWSGQQCAGQARQFTFDQAQVLGGGDWRTPSIRELASLIDCGNGVFKRLAYPKDGGGLILDTCDVGSASPKIHATAFPQSLSWLYWSSSQYEVGDPFNAWYANFNNGSVGGSFRSYGNAYVRLVR